MTRLIFWRHGRTLWNHTGRVQGNADVHLDEVGVAEAAAAAPALARLAPSLIMSSDLARATQTADALAALTGLTVNRDARLRERNFGPWQGLTRDEIEHRFGLPADGPFLAAAEAPGVEPVPAFADRVASVVRDVVERAGDTTVVLAVHAGTARVGTGELLGWPPSAWFTLAALGNCRRTELVRSPDRGWQLHSHNAA